MKRIPFVLSLICGVMFALGIAGFWIGHKAQKTSGMMESSPWLRNDRCLAAVRALPTPNSGFRFAVLGDVQTGAAGLPRLLNALKNEISPAFIVQTGDAVSHASTGYYRLFLKNLAGSGLIWPMFVIPGNHDVKDSSGGLFEFYFGPRQLWFEYGNALFILLDNAAGPFDKAQYNWLEDILETRTTGIAHRFLFMHGQPIHWEGDSKRPVEHLYKNLFDLLEKYKVDYVFTGNWHGYHREERNGTIFVVNGRGGDFDHNARMVPSYFTLVEVQGDRIQDICIELPPRAGIVIRCMLDDWFTAQLGELEMRNRWLTAGVLLLLVLGCALFLSLSKKV